VRKTPFWVDDYPRPDGLTSEPPEETDYLIVGSGYTGLSAARRLLSSSATVTIIDAGEIAGGASSINGGMVSTDVKAGMQTVLAYYGPRTAYDMWMSSVRGVELAREVAGAPEIDAILDERGMAELGRSSRDLKQLDRTVEWYRKKYAVDWRVVDAHEIGSIVGGEHFRVAMFKPEGFGVHPARLAFGLAKQVADAGGRLVDRCQAIATTRLNAEFIVHTTRGDIRAGDVIIATNGYTTRQPSKELARLVVPVGSYVIVTEPLDAGRASAVLPGGAMAHTRKRLVNYVRRTHDDRILFGGRRVGASSRTWTWRSRRHTCGKA
jgi:glycine/D-amino acid oxidase-like deaminating enzyme